MPPLSFTQRLALAAVLSALPLAASATADWLAAAATCTPADLPTLQSRGVNAAGGYVTSGRNPPQVYVCGVVNPDDVGGPASWRWLKLQYRDPTPTGAGVVARLYAKRRTSGSTTLLAEASSAAGSDAVSVLSVPVSKTMDFRSFLYHVVISLDPQGTTAVEAHAVMLTTN
jgi:hypothetical protein